MNFTIDKARLSAVKKLPLRRGSGKSLDDQICIMQAVDYITTGGFSDRPACACPALTSYAIRLNDRANDEQRQLMKPLITKLVGTHDAATKERAEYLVYNSITKVLPILVAATGLTADAKKLRAFKKGDWKAMREFCYDLKPRLREATVTKLKAKPSDATAADADATAADAYAASADADADAYYAAYAPKQNKLWKKVESNIWAAAFKGLKEACKIREAK